MSPRRTPLRATLFALALACACSPAVPAPEQARTPQLPERSGSLAQEIALARQGGRQPLFVAPTTAEMRTLERWTRARLSGRTPSPPEGFFVHALKGRPDVWIAREEEPRGSGIFVFGRGSSRMPVMVQVPHSFADLHTLPLGLTLFDTLDARALLVNTAHRHRGCPAEAVGCQSDAAHAERSYFQAVHRGVLSAHPDALTVAIHGFAEKPDDPLVILSSAGTPVDLNEIQKQLDLALAGLHPTPVLRFPDQVDRLGGLTGAQAKHVRRNAGRMLHLELSRGLRERMRDDPQLRKRFGEALERGLEVVR